MPGLRAEAVCRARPGGKPVCRGVRATTALRSAVSCALCAERAKCPGRASHFGKLNLQGRRTQ
eukprot:10800290-Alexandrium_andersonii.AAC.1